jgi:hypothetical protein
MRAPTRALRRRDLDVDAYIESYVEWREECEDLRGAYHRWAICGRLDRDLAFRAYRAALDREEKAALVHRSTAERLASRRRLNEAPAAPEARHV